MAQLLPCDKLVITDSIDSGNITRKATGRREAAARNVVELEIKNDVFTEFENTCHKQWFYFKVKRFSRVRAKFTAPIDYTPTGEFFHAIGGASYCIVPYSERKRYFLS